MRRVFIPGRLGEPGEAVTITGADAHHIMHSMRARAGEELVLSDGAGASARAELVSFAAGGVTARLVERVEDAPPTVMLELAQCLPKGDRMELIVQKASELGAERIHPIQSEHTVVRYDAAKARSRRERWQRIADEASGQCGRSRRPSVEPIRLLDDWLDGLSMGDGERLIFCYEGESRRGLKSCIEGSTAWRVLLLVGPEGGFSPEEAARVMEKGGESVSLGPRILRTETAAIAAMCAVQYELGDMGVFSQTERR